MIEWMFYFAKFLLILVSLQANAGKISSQELQANQASYSLDFSKADFPGSNITLKPAKDFKAETDCSIQSLGDEKGIRGTCLNRYQGIQITNWGSRAEGFLVLRTYIATNKNQEFYFNFHSSLPEGESSARLLNTFDLPRGNWFDWKIPLYSLNFQDKGDEGTQLGFGQIRDFYYYQSVVGDMTDPIRLTYPKQAQRAKLFLDSEAIRISDLEDIYFSSLRLEPSDFDFQDSELDGLPSYWDHSVSVGLLVLMVTVMLALVNLQYRYRISAKFLSLFLTPTLLFLLSQYLILEPVLSKMESDQLHKAKRKLLHYKELVLNKGLGNEEFVTSKIREYSRYFYNAVKKLKKNEKGIPYRALQAGIDERRIANTRTQTERLALLDEFTQKYFAIFRKVYGGNETVLALIDQYEKNLPDLSDPSQDSRLFRILEDYSDEADEFCLQMRMLYNKYGIDLSFTNSQYFFRYKRRGIGTGQDSSISRIMHKQVFSELKRTPDTDLHKYLSDMAQLKELRKSVEESGIDVSFMDKFFNQSGILMRLIAGSRKGNRRKYIWDFHVGENGDQWYMYATVHHGALYQMNEFLRTLNASSEHDLTVFLQGQHHEADMPLELQNEGLFSTVASFSRKYDTDRFHVEQSEGNSWLYLSSPFTHEPMIQMVLRQDLMPALTEVRNLKNRFYLLSWALVLILTMISSMISLGVLRPIQSIQLLIQKIQRRIFNEPVKISSKDEFWSLGENFNEFASGLLEKEQITSFLSTNIAQDILSTSSTEKRQVVTILFAGIVNLEEILRRDDAQYLMDQFVKQCHSSVYSRNGTVDKFTGMAILGVFQDHDAAKQAYFAGNEIVAMSSHSYSGQLKVGVGVASGEVVMGHVGSPGRKDFTCIGNTVNMSARLESLGKKSNKRASLFLDASSYSQLDERDQSKFSFDEIPIKGKAKNQEVYELKD